MEMKKAIANIFAYAYGDVLAWFTTLWGPIAGFAALFCGVALSLFQKYLFRDLAFLPWLLIAISLDTWAGYLLAKKKWKSDPVNNVEPTGRTLKEKVGGKLVAIVIILCALNLLTNFELNGLPAQTQFIDIPLFGYKIDLNVFKVIYFTGASFMIIMEVKSIFRNVRALGYNFVPKTINDTLEKFTGNEEDKI